MSNTTKAFNIITNATGFINDIRDVNVKKGNGFIAIKASLKDGVGEDAETKFIDLIVRGKQAKKVCEFLEDYWPTLGQKDNASLFASMSIGSIDVKTYKDRKGEIQAKLCGRLLSFNYLSINGQAIDLADFSSESSESSEKEQQVA